MAKENGFDPLLYTYRDKKTAFEDSVIDVTGKDSFFVIATSVREKIRLVHGGKLGLALIDLDTREFLKEEIARIVIEEKISLSGCALDELIVKLTEELLFYGPIQKALDDPLVTNIDINSYKDVYLEREGNEEYHPEMGFTDEDHLEVILNKMLMAGGKALTANEPHIDSLFEKYRICAVLGQSKGGIAGAGTCASIRKFSDITMTSDDLIKYGTMSPDMDEFFKLVLPFSNTIIAGATNSGKTTTLMTFPLYFDKTTRIITIEDSPELLLTKRSGYMDYHNIVALQSKDHENPEKRFDIARLTKVSLRMRPTKIIIGEVRDKRACKQAHECMNTGHTTYFTIHASSARNAATRIVQLAGDGYNDEVIASQLASTVDLIIFQQKIGKKRIITEVCELTGYEGAKKPICNTIFKFEPKGTDESGEVYGIHKRLDGISRDLADKLIAGKVPREKIEKWLKKGEIL